jgi:monoamine oxidase
VLLPMQEGIERARGEFRLNEQVASISHNEDAGVVTISTTSGSTHAAKSCVCTIPLGVLKHSLQHEELSFDPPLPQRRLHSISAAGFGLLNKIVISYPMLWWPEDVGILHVVQKDEKSPSLLPNAVNAPALFIISYVPITGKPVLCVFMGGNTGATLENLSDTEAQEWIHSILKRCLLAIPGAPSSAPDPEQCIVTRWQADPFARGSYTYIPVEKPDSAKKDSLPPTPLDLVELSRPLWEGRLGFAGEHTGAAPRSIYTMSYGAD